MRCSNPEDYWYLISINKIFEAIDQEKHPFEVPFCLKIVKIRSSAIFYIVQ
jgi:hypothetical protein